MDCWDEARNNQDRFPIKITHRLRLPPVSERRTASDDRVRVGDSTQVKTPDRALRVHRFGTHDIGLEYH